MTNECFSILNKIYVYDIYAYYKYSINLMQLWFLMIRLEYLLFVIHDPTSLRL